MVLCCLLMLGCHNIVSFTFRVIRRSRKWLYDSLSRSYLEFFKADGLLGAGGWPGAATNELHMFWHERFMIPTPPELIVLLFPFLPNLEQAIKELGAAASLSMHAAPLILSTWLGWSSRMLQEACLGCILTTTFMCYSTHHLY